MDKPITPFCLLLKHSTAVRLGPKTTLDIPVSFAPEEMKKYEGVVTVKVRQENGSAWTYNLAEERYTFFYFKFCGDKSPFCWPTSTCVSTWNSCALGF